VCWKIFTIWFTPALLAGLWSTSLAYATVTAPNGTDTDPLNLQPATQEAFQHFYDLDYAGAQTRFAKIAAEHPEDPIAADYLLNNAVFQELYRLDLLDTTLYVQDGFLSGKHGVTEDQKTTAHIEALYHHALQLADARLAKNPNDTDALFARGFGTSLETVYIGMVEKKYTAALKMALAARRDNDQVLRNDPKYVDAYLIVGVHEYVLGSLALPFKILAGIVGIHGSKSKGLAELRRVGQYGIINSVSARTALSIFLRREAHYMQAIAVIDGLEQQYPRNFLFALENANLLKDSGQGMKAIAAYQALIANLKRYPNPHPELAYYGLGEAARGQRHYHIALAAYLSAASQPTASPLMQRRAHLRAGQVDDLLGQRQQAIQQYDAVIALGPQFSQAQQAEKLRETAYKGT
jgi:tetratricopeptide (TPR) repeat protein